MIVHAFILCCASCGQIDGPPADTRPLVGAIRWDGWFAGNTWERNLDPPEWRYRLPFFAKELPEGKVEVNEDSQEVMDQEIAYAKAGGLSYWAFCYYHPDSWKEADSYNYGWRRFMASPKAEGLKFCFLLQSMSHIGPPAEWPKTADFLVSIFKHPLYQSVMGGRPLVYMFSGASLPSHFGSPEAARAAFDLLRSKCVEAGLGQPYMVAQIWLHEKDAPWVRELGFDAVSSYSSHGGSGGEETYAALAKMNKGYWDTFAATEMQVIPTLNTGWDGRPRKYDGAWYQSPKPEELTANLTSALDWVRAHKEKSPANTVLFYAWNEFDEGGWICPTLAEGTTRLDAIKAALSAK